MTGGEVGLMERAVMGGEQVGIMVGVRRQEPEVWRRGEMARRE